MAKIKNSTLHRIGKQLFKYVYKNPQKNMLRLVRVAKIAAKNMYPASTFTTPIDIISNKEG